MLTLLIVRKSVDLCRITYRLYFLVFKKCISTKFCQRWQVERWPSVGVAAGFLARDVNSALAGAALRSEAPPRELSQRMLDTLLHKPALSHCRWGGFWQISSRLTALMLTFNSWGRLRTHLLGT